MAYFKCKGDASENPEYLYKWDFTKSLTDEVQGVTATLVWNASRNSTGVHFSHGLDAMNMSPNPINMNGKTIEIDIASFVFAGDNSRHVRFIMNASSNTAGITGTGMLIRRSTNLKWNTYLPNSQATEYSWGDSWNIQDSDLNGHTLKMSCEDGNKLSMWIDDQLVDTKQGDYTYLSSPECDYLRIGGFSYLVSDGDQCYDMTITGIRIYNNPKPKPKPNPKKLLLAEWDFSSNTPLVDKVNGYQLTSKNVTFPTVEGEIVASFAGYSSYLLIPNEASFRLSGDYTSMSYIIDFKKCNSTGAYAMGYYDAWPDRMYSGCALTYQHFSSTNRWDFGNYALLNRPSNANYFDDSQMAIKFTKETGNKVIPELYKDGDLVSTSQEITNLDFMGRYALGANSDALYMQIRGLKVVVE